MAGVLFIINVPQKDHEEQLRIQSIDKTKPCTVYELQQNKKFGRSVESYAQDEINIVISKCKSTDCLSSDKNADLHKSKSEVALNVNEYLNDGKNYVKSSWEEMKQMLKLKKNKLKITGPVRGVDILGAFHWDTPLETILLEVVGRLAVKNATWNATRNNKFWQVTFSLESGYLCEELLQVLRTFGIGSRLGSSVCVVPCALYYDSNQQNESSDGGKFEDTRSETNSAWSRFSSSVRARTNLAQVLHDVRADAALTFDWLFLLIAAGFVAAIGLMENSTIILVASMLISPLMGPITAGTLGTAVRDRSLQYMGVVHELMGLFLCLVIGFVFGLAICAVDGRYGVVDDWPTPEMMARCEFRSLFVGILIAIPSGACVALAVLSDYTSSLVGVAISASLLPPAVNAGLLWAMSLFRMVATNSELNWVVMAPAELAVLGTASLCLTLINIVCIFVTGVIVYKVKAVCPLERRDITWWRANKNRWQSSKQGRTRTDEPAGGAAWDVYSKWSNDTTEDSKDTDAGIVQSDTVTFRRPGMMQRKRAQSIEEGFRNAQIDDSYQPLDSDTTEYESRSSSDDKTECMSHHKNNVDNFGCYNFGYDSQDPIKTSSPTIEPSLNHTVEPKRNAA